MKVLIIEDDFISRKYLRDLIKYSGYECVTAKNASEGLDLYYSFKPNAIICNIIMPGISGLEYLQKIRSLDRHTIIIMITNFSSERLAINALRLGANDYIQKPIQDNDILPTLKRIGSKINLDDDNNFRYGAIDSGRIVMKFNTEIGAPRMIVDRLMSEVAENYFEEEARTSIELGLSELVTNAIEHGNLNITYKEKTEVLKNDKLTELYQNRLNDQKLASRQVTVEYSFSENQCEWIITDEGDGFDPNKVPNPIADENLENLSGRGIFISKFFFDSVEYLGKGNKVHVIKKCQKSEC
ncbi:MAG: response regulator [Bacteroidales bacterium]|nr:response regulator [Bacteroidales bacterium]